jgi:hypothetical protein
MGEESFEEEEQIAQERAFDEERVLHQRQPLRYMAPQVSQETLTRDDWSTCMSRVHR